MADQKMITKIEDLRLRLRSGQHLEHDVKGYFLKPSLERVSPVAVAQERMRVDRMKQELGIDGPRLSRSR